VADGHLTAFEPFMSMSTLADFDDLAVPLTADSVSANVSTRAIKHLTLTGRYRHNSRTDFTHEFDAVEYVRFDAVPEETGGITHALNISRNTFDADASFSQGAAPGFIELYSLQSRMAHRIAEAREKG